jgi:hypothetical protein
MSTNKPFDVVVEGRVFSAGGRVDVGSHSSVVTGDFAGWVSLSSKDFEITDEEVFDLLNVAHARKSFVWDFLELHDQKTCSLQELGIDCTDAVDFKDMWINCRIEQGYLEDVIGSRDGGEMILESLDKYDTEVDIVGSV